MTGAALLALILASVLTAAEGTLIHCTQPHCPGEPEREGPVPWMPLVLIANPLLVCVLYYLYCLRSVDRQGRRKGRRASLTETLNFLVPYIKHDGATKQSFSRQYLISLSVLVEEPDMGTFAPLSPCVHNV
ncbi:hypothetical protein T484DRAFT_1778587 [Baffinella frigidus]|jgi:hypothetical protein|nr:hypothetical protein T484DRAFT_1778587 [Cryptophyta sp. CCMP2293]